jgi:hypothetical protein
MAQAGGFADLNGVQAIGACLLGKIRAGREQ